ncbi:unnamed protein product [Closterium sp. Naga37s-1]|nr:unnamed protein product [Closterium sp. Naga37s-1]
MAVSVLSESRHRRRWSVPVMPVAAFLLVACASCFLTTRARGESSLVGHGERPSFHTKFPRRPRSEARVVEANVENQTLTIGVLTGEELGQGLSFRSAIRLALEDVQADPSLTFPYPLRLSFGNTGSTRFQAQAAALQTMLGDALLVLGPEYSSQAHSIIDLCRDYQVPMLSFSATDPTLSSKGQFPYFVRLSHSDQMEMEVIADILQYYQWHQAIMIYSDDEFGHNGMDALTNILMAKSQQLPLQFSNKVALDPRATNEEITQLLRAMQSSETSVFVVHVASSNVLFLLDEVQRMGQIDRRVRVDIQRFLSPSHHHASFSPPTFLVIFPGCSAAHGADERGVRVDIYRGCHFPPTSLAIFEPTPPLLAHLPPLYPRVSPGLQRSAWG